MSMWIPTPLYEKAPHYWLVLGLFLIIIGAYLGFEIQRWYMYIGITLGLASCLWSARTYWQRALQREQAEQAAEKAKA